MAERPHRWPFGVARAFKRARLRRVRRALIREPDFHEVLVDAGSLEDSLVASHWVVYVPRLLELLAGVLFLAIVPVSSPDSAWLPLLIGAGLIAHAAWRSYVVFMDVLVITEIRIFRITGVPMQKRASMPLSRVLDITVDRSLLGAILALRPHHVRVGRPDARPEGREVRARPVLLGEADPLPRPHLQQPQQGRRHGFFAVTLPFDPIDEAARQWGQRWDGVPTGCAPSRR